MTRPNIEVRNGSGVRVASFREGTQTTILGYPIPRSHSWSMAAAQGNTGHPKLDGMGYTAVVVPEEPQDATQSVDDWAVSAEAARRIEEAFPASSQIGALATMLDHIRTNGQPDPMAWKPDQRAAYIKAATLWGWTKAVHAAAAAVVAMTPIPADYADDKYWPKVPV